MQTNFTSGPWRVGDAGCTVFGPPNGNPAPKRIADMAKTPEYKANARLIASSPDLYAALDKAESELERMEAATGQNCDERVMMQIRAVLSRARGLN